MYLGLDIGTSGVKALLLDPDQALVASATAPLACETPAPGWSEQDPDAWIAATKLAIAQLRKDAPQALAAVRGIGLSGQMHGATTLDAGGRPLRPAILWNDTRSAAEASALDANPLFRELTGNIVFPGFTAPKLVWMQRHEPKLFEQVAMVLLPKDYLRLWLTGEYISEMSDSAGTSWLDVRRRQWSDALLAETGMNRAQMPNLIEGTEAGGHLRAAIAAQTGLPAGIPVAGGAGDNAASAVGAGTISAGSGFASIGTSGVLFTATDCYAPNAESAVHTFCHALPDTWHQMGVILSAANSINWLSDITGQTPEALTNSLGESLLAPSEAVFLPYLSGERTPHNDARARGVFLGLSHATGPAEMTQAVLEGIAFAFADNLAALSAAGTRLESVLAIGGGARSGYLLQALATALDLPLDLPTGADLGAGFGAARLAMIAAEGADPAEVCAPPDILKTIEPVAGLKVAFQDRFAIYKAAYRALEPING